MTRKSHARYQLSLPTDLSARFDKLAAKPGASKSSIFAAALASFFDHGGASELEEKFAIRLDRISRQLGRIERNAHVEIETLALFVRYMLSVNAPLAEEDEVSRAIGRDRFAAFVKRVSQQIASGRRTFEAEEQQ